MTILQIAVEREKEDAMRDFILRRMALRPVTVESTAVVVVPSGDVLRRRADEIV